MQLALTPYDRGMMDVAKKPVEPETKPARQSTLVRFAPLALIVAATLALIASGAHRQLTIENLLASRDALQARVDANFPLAIALYLLVYTCAVALSLPGALLLTIAGGFLFGGFAGAIATTIAATVGASLIFLAAQSSLGEVLRRRAGPWLTKFREGFAKDAASYLLFLRLVPAFPFWLVNLAPALFDVKLKTFIWTTAIGILPGTFAYSFAGAGLDSVVAAQKQAFAACLASGASDCKAHIYLHQLVTKELVLAFAALGIVALIPVAINRWRARNAALAQTGAP